MESVPEANGYMKFLDTVVVTKRREIAALQAQEPLSAIKTRAQDAQDKISRRGFRSLFDSRPVVMIAEIKPTSPTAGKLIEKDPIAIADIYAKSDADVISVLTDKDYFGGSLELLEAVRARVPQSVLRKDFIIDEYQVYETACSNADVFLLIAAILTTEEIKNLQALGKQFGLDALVEVHDEDDLKKALEASASVIGINNRDLLSLKIDLHTTQKLLPLIPKSIPVVSESGIYSAADAAMAKGAGARGLLVGTSILQSKEPLAFISTLKNSAL